MSLRIIRRFPDISNPSFSFKKWDSKFYTHNVILNGHYSEIYYPLHWTPLSIKCAFGGTEFYETSKVRYAVDDKRYLILNEGTLYNSYINSENKVESFTLNFRREFVDGIFSAVSMRDEDLLDSSGYKKAPEFFEQLHEYDDSTLYLLNNLRSLINNSEPDEDRINEILHIMLRRIFTLHLTNLVKAKRLNAVKYSTRVEIFRRLNYAKDFIYSNYYEKIDLDKLAKIACLSPYHFLRSFKAAYGQTPHKFLTIRRLEAARNLLTQTGKSITEICQQVGFESLSSFGVLFKKHYRSSPEEFRQASIK